MNTPARSCTRLLAALLASFCATLTPLLSAKSQEVRLATADATIGARVGAAVAVDKDVLVVGAPDDDQAGPFAGAAYVFVQHGNTWQKHTKLLGPVTSGYRSFGDSVAVSGKTVVIGAPFDDPNGTAMGAAYVYTRSGSNFTLQAKLQPSDPSVNQLFGDAVAIDGDTIVVGAFLDGSRAPNAGAVYVFTRQGTTWKQRAKLTASDASEYAFFGSAVAINSGTLVIGAPTTETSYIFSQHGQTWTQEGVLTASDASVGDYSAFGASVAIDGTTIVIGAPTEGTDAPLTGAAYVFKKSKTRWVEQQKLRSAHPEGGAEFGTGVAVSGQHLAVGSPYAGDSNAGDIELFAAHGSSWKEKYDLTGDPATAFLGASVALESDTLVGGAPAFVDYSGTQSAGAAYVFRAH